MRRVKKLNMTPDSFTELVNHLKDWYLNQKYNNGLGRTKFQRSIEVMRAEWNEHTYLCETELGEHAKHVDINSDADGTPAQIWHDWLD